MHLDIEQIYNTFLQTDRCPHIFLYRFRYQLFMEIVDTIPSDFDFMLYLPADRGCYGKLNVATERSFKRIELLFNKRLNDNKS
ncbi:hypothetical protein HR13_04455 [Porphyromonas gulae]|nr:hypothetical protein HR13_04455 [Porphyromonas gulae]KGO01997.1 hypothetical protein HQ42_09370 [Porphyromonas gulae]